MDSLPFCDSVASKKMVCFVKQYTCDGYLLLPYTLKNTERDRAV
jgi:hypothetical protein